MIPENSFLRRLPMILDPVIRMKLESLVFSADVATHALNNLRTIASAHLLDVRSIDHKARIGLFSNAWTIVDQLHVLRELLYDFMDGKFGPAQERMYKASECATLLRNKMDHLRQNIANLAKRKGAYPPLFGSLSYFIVSGDDLSVLDGKPTLTGGRIITLGAGSSPSETKFALVNPIGKSIMPPVGQFKLHAFDSEIDLEEMVHDMGQVLLQTTQHAQRDLEEQCHEHARVSGIPVEKLMAPPPIGNFAVALRVEFRPQADDVKTTGAV